STLTPDGDGDAANLLVHVTGVPVGLLVDDGVDRDGRLTGLAVADDQLALSAAHRDHGVDRLDSGLHGLVNRLALHDAGSLQLEGAAPFCLDLSQTVDRVAERVDHTTEVCVADRNREHVTGAGDLLASLDAAELTQDDNTDLALVQAQGQAEGAVSELDELVRHDAGEALHVGDAVCGVDYVPDLAGRGLR